MSEQSPSCEDVTPRHSDADMRAFAEMCVENYEKKQLVKQGGRKREDVKLDRKGYQAQFDFNQELMELMTEAEKNKEEFLTKLKNRNELLRVADKNPAVFDLLEAKKKAEELRITDPILAEIIEEQAREKKKEDRKRRHSPSARQPFRYREPARQPGSRFSSGYQKDNGYFYAPHDAYGYSAPPRPFFPERRDRSRDVCKVCGQQGHWAPDCPRRTDRK